MTDHDDEKTPREPDAEAPDGHESEDSPAAATWAGRHRASSEEAGEHPQLPADEPAQDGDGAQEPEEHEQPEEAAPPAEEAPEEPQAEEADEEPQAGAETDEAQDEGSPDEPS